MFIDTITTNDKQLLLIESGGVVKLYEWLSKNWEPIAPQEAKGLVMSGKAHVRGILLANAGKEEDQF